MVCHLIPWYPAWSCLPLTPNLPWYTTNSTEKVSTTVLQILSFLQLSLKIRIWSNDLGPKSIPKFSPNFTASSNQKKSRTFQAVDLEKKQAGQVKNFTRIKRSCASKNLPTKSSSPRKASNCHFTGIAETFETWPSWDGEMGSFLAIQKTTWATFRHSAGHFLRSKR